MYEELLASSRPDLRLVKPTSEYHQFEKEKYLETPEDSFVIARIVLGCGSSCSSE